MSIVFYNTKSSLLENLQEMKAVTILRNYTHQYGSFIGIDITIIFNPSGEPSSSD